MGHRQTHGQEVLTEDEDKRDALLRIETGRVLFAHECKFVRSAADMTSLPPIGAPEVAFAGRSNVGKSSLINALTGHTALARTSNTPGRTQLINFFDLAGRLLLVDMPGYGFAKAPKDEIARWTKLVETYLKGRPTLRRACLLVDSRHGLKDSDKNVMELLDKAAVTYQLVLTKSDKVRAGELDALTAGLSAEIARHPAAHPEIVRTSSETGSGIPDLRAELAALALPDEKEGGR
jgi:GTP-binding protein